jgi:uncharacterized protein (TIGR02246 family)
MRHTRALLLIVAALAGCVKQEAVAPAAAPADTREADLAAIAETNRLTLQALNTNDLELMNSLVAENHIMMMPGRDDIAGREAIVAANSNLVDSWTNVETWTPEETVVFGDHAYQRGRFDITLTPKKEGVRAIRSKGKYLHIYERQKDGRWLMIRDMFSDDGSVAREAKP